MLNRNEDPQVLGKGKEMMKLTRSTAFMFVLAIASVLWGVNGFADVTTYTFDYADRAALTAAGWDFNAVIPSGGGARDTEQAAGAVVSYDQGAHPGLLRIPLDLGDLWQGTNNSRNTLFRDLPADWTSIRLKLAAFAPTQYTQQAGILAYQDDDNYVQVTRIYAGENRVSFTWEKDGAAVTGNSALEPATENIWLRLDRDPSTNTLAASYSIDNEVTWTYIGTTRQTLGNPRLAIFAGASPSGFPNADLAYAVVSTDPVVPPNFTYSVNPAQLVFNGIAGTPTPTIQTVRVEGGWPAAWTAVSNVTWLTATPGSGAMPDTFDLTVDTSALTPGIYPATVSVSVDGAGNSPQTVGVVLIVNPDVAAKVSVWKDARKGAMSVSTDDGRPSCSDKLLASGFRGTYVANGTVTDGSAPDYASLYASGMELGSHLVTHPCYWVPEETLRDDEIEPNIDGLATVMPREDIVTLAWPCGFTTMNAQIVAADYFLSARGYNYNLLENPTPANFFDLKSFNSHEHEPYPPSDLKSVVDAAEDQGKWANLVFHDACNDDEAIAHATTKDVWVAPIGTVIKYILQRDRFVLSDYVEDPSGIAFSYYRLEIPSSAVREFETAIRADDVVTIAVDVDDARTIQAVRVGEDIVGYDEKTIGGNRYLMINRVPKTVEEQVAIEYAAVPTPIISVDPGSLTFAALVGTSPADRTLGVSNAGAGTLNWSAAVESTPAGWLAVNPGSGTGDGVITVSVNSAALAVGTYSGTVTISATAATPRTVQVSLVVTALPAPVIDISQTNLTFTTRRGESPAEQAIDISNAGVGTLNWAVTAESTPEGWLAVTPATGTGAGPITVSVDSDGLRAGTYNGTITIAADGAANSPRTVDVALTVEAAGHSGGGGGGGGGGCFITSLWE